MAFTAAAHACSAVSAEAQAVSYEAHGPCSPITKEMRPAATEVVSLVAAYAELEPKGVHVQV